MASVVCKFALFPFHELIGDVIGLLAVIIIITMQSPGCIETVEVTLTIQDHSHKFQP